jgi:hypothetical protein
VGGESPGGFLVGPGLLLVAGALAGQAAAVEGQGVVRVGLEGLGQVGRGLLGAAAVQVELGPEGQESAEGPVALAGAARGVRAGGGVGASYGRRGRAFVGSPGEPGPGAWPEDRPSNWSSPSSLLQLLIPLLRLWRQGRP